MNQKAIAECLAVLRPAVKGRFPHEQALEELVGYTTPPAAPVQEPVIGETNVELGFYSNDASNGQQRKLVGKMEMGQLVGNRPHESASNPDTEREIAVIAGVDEYGPMLNWYTHWVNFPVGTALYTSPPAQRTWVGLTDEEILYCVELENPKATAEEVDAKLREKNT